MSTGHGGADDQQLGPDSETDELIDLEEGAGVAAVSAGEERDDLDDGSDTPYMPDPGTEMSFDAAEAMILARGAGRMIPDLDRITLLLELLGQPQRAYPTIHVTGTNGKGSAVRIVSALLASAGLSAGTYTSPHLQTIRERLAVSGRRIGERAFADLYADVAPLAALVDERSADSVTYFELLTAMASWWFAEVPVDVGVFEVGMGGTWDATNLVRGDVCIIQPIDIDHAQLGSTPAEIAKEKAGIIKADSMVVCAAQRSDVMAVLRARCDDIGATLFVAGIDHELLSREPANGGQVVSVRIGARTIDSLFIPLLGAHQADNLVVALAAVAALLGETFDDLTDEAWRQGLLSATVPGRLEIVSRSPTVVLDGAHNPHGARAAAAAVRETFDASTPRVLLTGILDDKDVDGVLSPWRDVVQHVVVTRVASPRSASAQRLAIAANSVWEGTGVTVERAADLMDALEIAEGLVGEDGVVIVSGSLMHVGAARDRYLPVLDDDDEIIYEPDDIDDEEDERRFEVALDQMLEDL
jgi:dihydrofolate synthase/folylpolyglutamate synthase